MVDLDGFEPSTSSMPFKKYQSLTGISTRNKRLSTRLGGRRWTPRGDFLASGLHADSRTPHLKLARDVPSRAVVGDFDCCLLETTTWSFLIRRMPMWKSATRPARSVTKTIFLPSRRPVGSAAKLSCCVVRPSRFGGRRRLVY